jgi:hypothetical protein
VVLVLFDLNSKFILKWLWKTNLYKKRKGKNKLTSLPVARWPGSLLSRPALSPSLFLLGPPSRAAHFPFRSLACGSAQEPLLLRVSFFRVADGWDPAVSRVSSSCRNRAGHELNLHRIKLDLPRISIQVEVSQPHIS